jgi:hypothetical protein
MNHQQANLSLFEIIAHDGGHATSSEQEKPWLMRVPQGQT